MNSMFPNYVAFGVPTNWGAKSKRGDLEVAQLPEVDAISNKEHCCQKQVSLDTRVQYFP